MMTVSKNIIISKKKKKQPNNSISHDLFAQKSFISDLCGLLRFLKINKRGNNEKVGDHWCVRVYIPVEILEQYHADEIASYDNDILILLFDRSKFNQAV